jgi:hypothetical protein
MTLQERIESFATMSASLLAQLNQLKTLHEKVRQTEAALVHKKIPVALARRGEISQS